MSQVKIIFPDESEITLPNPYNLETVENAEAGFDVQLEGHLCGSFEEESDADAFEAVVRTAITEKLAQGGLGTITIDDLRS